MKKYSLILLLLILPLGITLAQGLQPDDSNAVINIMVIDHNSKAIAGEKIMVQSEKTQKVYSGITDANGKFSILVPYGCNYTFKYKQFTTDAAYDRKLPIPSGVDKNGNPQRFTLNFTLRIELPKKYELRNVFFDTGKSTLRPESNKELNELVEFMSLQKTMVIEIAGYTDNVGTDAANQKLSQDRADAVRNYLVNHKIPANQLQAKGYGASDPVASNDTPEGRQQNRRTEVHIINP
jgi:outer membrane protein OmpA-like peptidoglycan-associated protein